MKRACCFPLAISKTLRFQAAMAATWSPWILERHNQSRPSSRCGCFGTDDRVFGTGTSTRTETKTRRREMALALMVAESLVIAARRETKLAPSLRTTPVLNSTE